MLVRILFYAESEVASQNGEGPRLSLHGYPKSQLSIHAFNPCTAWLLIRGTTEGACPLSLNAERRLGPCQLGPAWEQRPVSLCLGMERQRCSNCCGSRLSV